ncbi:MAG TPA: coniferyl aldehyde dehydrogenase, partial [Ochrobactrum intermedium]|nr:coniferyl aldehyde dehydrogenase [Brucella intermedia]
MPRNSSLPARPRILPMAAEEQMLQLPFERLRHAWLESRPACEQRLDDLKRLRERLEARLDEMAKAISADFGNRSLHETLLGEASVVFAEIDDALHNLKRW